MKSVNVKTEWLLEKVKENRENHRAAFEEAFEGYRQAAIKALETNLELFKQGKRTQLRWNESAPEDHTKDYDRTIEMLEASVDSEVELASDEFANFVQDDWHWMQNWTVANTKYMTMS